jgi:hypothetical protein
LPLSVVAVLPRCAMKDVMERERTPEEMLVHGCSEQVRFY